MTTAVDSSVLLDVFGADRTFLRPSLEALGSSAAAGELVACGVVWSEIAAFFPSADAAGEAMERIGVRFSPMSSAAALRSGRIWSKYRREGGTRTRIVSDFLIGAHALAQADRLLTRDRGFHRRYFEDLDILDPSEQ